MSSDPAELWQRILSFSIDGPVPVSLPFSTRLARENGWSQAFSDKAIFEYKRFVFLAMTAGHPVCPSDKVDQVWHLHLTYTRSYWHRFQEVLGRPLHHDPTQGGPAESLKHQQMYEATLASYQRLFGSVPPPEYWPPAARRFDENNQHRQVNLQCHWIISKAPVKRGLAAGLLLGAAGVASGCVGPILADAQSERELYLLLYVVAIIGAFAVASLIRRSLRKPEDSIEVPEGILDHYDYALLAGGPIRVFDACLVRLMDQGAIRYDGKDKFYVAGPLPSDADPFESQVYEAVAYGAESGRLVEMVRKSVKFELEPRREKLRELGLLLSESSTRRAVLFPLLLLLASTFGLALPRIIAGMGANKPFGFIMILMVMSFVVSLATFGRVPRRTLRGDAFMKLVRFRFATIGPHRLLDRQNIVLGTALLGTAALASTEFAPLAKALHPLRDPTAGGGGCSSGCSSSCGGGDGGGGGCGGGCGGGGD